MHNLLRGLSAFCLLTMLSTATAEQAPQQLITQSITGARPDLAISSVEPSRMPGIYAVKIVNGPTLYASADGKFFVAGDLFAVRGEGIVNLAEEQRQQGRVAELAKIKSSDMVIFKPQKTKAVVTVFTDIDCGYCQKLHQEVPELNRMGIEVRYLAFPRGGVGSQGYDKLVTAWCAKDNSVLTRLKNRENVPMQTCANNKVAAQYKLGQQLGVNGTPALITDDGKILPGYVPAAELAKALGLTPG